MANSPVKAPNPFLAAEAPAHARPAFAPPPAAEAAPLVSLDQIPHAIQASPAINRPTAPATVSAIPSLFVKSGNKRRRAIIVVSSLIILGIVALVGVMIFSRAMH